MGGSLQLRGGASLKMSAAVSGLPEGTVEFVSGGDGKPPNRTQVPVRGLPEVTAELRSTPRLKWVRADVRGPDGRLLLIGNPVYLQN